MHVLPSGFHRIRYYGFLTCQTRANNIERIRELLAVPLIPVNAIKAASATASTSAQPEEPKAPVVGGEEPYIMRRRIVRIRKGPVWGPSHCGV